MKLIPLTQGKFAQVDDEDFEYLNQFKWQASKNRSSTFYATRSINHDKKIFMHKDLMKPIDGLVIDHIDRNGLNNQKSNFRYCTKSQNQMNRKKYPNKSSKYFGVSATKIKSGDKEHFYWLSRITKEGSVYLLGHFKTEEEAASAYNRKSTELHGEFAKLNKLNGIIL